MCTIYQHELPGVALHHLFQEERHPERVWQGILSVTQDAFSSDLV